MTANLDEMRRKAEAGSCVNQSALGIRYLHGIDVEVDHKLAFRFLSAAAEQGASRAFLNLAYMHLQGLGVPKDVPEGIRLLEAVGRPDDSSDAFLARIELGRIYSRGLTGSVDVEKAVQWYLSAVNLRSHGDDSEELQEAKDYLASRQYHRS